MQILLFVIRVLLAASRGYQAPRPMSFGYRLPLGLGLGSFAQQSHWHLDF